MTRKKVPAAPISMAAVSVHGWNNLTPREVELLRPVLLAADRIFDPACTALFATEPGAAVVPNTVIQEEEERVAAETARDSELCLMTIDKQYPVLPFIRSLLPDDERLVTRVLSNPEAAKAIMQLSDVAYCSREMEVHGGTGDQDVSVILDGESMKLPYMNALELRIWLDMRDITTTNLGVGALKAAVLKRVKYSTHDELDKAKARLQNVVKDFQRMQ